MGGHGGQHCGKKNCIAIVVPVFPPFMKWKLLFAGSGAAEFINGEEKSAAFPFVPKPGETHKKMVWEEVLFYSKSPFLGDILVTLNRDYESTGLIESLSPTGEPFFPAKATNTFFFKMKIPRFGLTLINKKPLKNTTTIQDWPPYGQTYVQVEPTAFRTSEGRVTFITLKESKVRIDAENGLKNSIELISRGPGKKLRFRGSISNLTPDHSVNLVWYVTSQRGLLAGHKPSYGFQQVGRQPLSFEFESNFVEEAPSAVMELYAASTKDEHKWCYASTTVKGNK